MILDFRRGKLLSRSYFKVLDAEYRMTGLFISTGFDLSVAVFSGIN